MDDVNYGWCPSIMDPTHLGLVNIQDQSKLFLRCFKRRRLRRSISNQNFFLFSHVYVMCKIYQILCPSNVTKICCQQLFVLPSWNYDFSTIFPFTESTHICALYMVQTLCNMKCRFCALKIETPKVLWYLKFIKIVGSDLTFWLRLDFIMKYIIALVPNYKY